MRNLLVGFFVVCSVSRSQATGPVAPPPARAVSPVITRLVYRHETIVVRAGPAGPTYSVEDENGRVLIGDSTIEQLAGDQAADGRPRLRQRIDRSQATWAGL